MIVESRIERVQLKGGDRDFSQRLGQAKRSRRYGWSVDVLIARDYSHAVFLACRVRAGERRRRRPDRR
jgi:hypothetical protein